MCGHRSPRHRAPGAHVSRSSARRAPGSWLSRAATAVVLALAALVAPLSGCAAQARFHAKTGAAYPQLVYRAVNVEEGEIDAVRAAGGVVIGSISARALALTATDEDLAQRAARVAAQNGGTHVVLTERGIQSFTVTTTSTTPAPDPCDDDGTEQTTTETTYEKPTAKFVVLLVPPERWASLPASLRPAVSGAPVLAGTHSPDVQSAAPPVPPLVQAPPALKGQEETVAVAVRYDAPAACPSAAAYEAGVTARAPNVRFVSEGQGSRILLVALTVDAGGATGKLAVREADGRRTNQRELHAASCAQMLDALTLVSALAIEPAGGVAAGPASPRR